MLLDGTFVPVLGKLQSFLKTAFIQKGIFLLIGCTELYNPFTLIPPSTIKF